VNDRRVLAAACLTALIIAACGGGKHSSNPQEAQQVTQTLRTYLHAQSAGDGQAACAVLTTAAQQQLSTLVVQGSNGSITTPPSCPDAVRLVRTLAGSQIISALGSAQIEHVQVNGSQATADVVDGALFGTQQVVLQKAGGTWKIAGVPGLGG
jgi:hypothetical protein